MEVVVKLPPNFPLSIIATVTVFIDDKSRAI